MFCENKVDCRRAQVLAYFGEKFDPSQCKGTCDNCQRQVNFTTKNIATDAQHIIQMRNFDSFSSFHS